jgi:anti-sigma B factor antagonist
VRLRIRDTMDAMAFSVTTDLPNEPGDITLAGELDLSAVTTIDAAIRDSLADPRTSTVKLDLAGATFIDSTALGALVRGRRAAIEQGRRFVVVNANGHVLRVLEITGVAPTLFTGE